VHLKCLTVANCRKSHESAAGSLQPKLGNKRPE
jgi:hypothetical protein